LKKARGTDKFCTGKKRQNYEDSDSLCDVTCLRIRIMFRYSDIFSDQERRGSDCFTTDRTRISDKADPHISDNNHVTSFG